MALIMRKVVASFRFDAQFEQDSIVESENFYAVTPSGYTVVLSIKFHPNTVLTVCYKSGRPRTIQCSFTFSLLDVFKDCLRNQKVERLQLEEEITCVIGKIYPAFGPMVGRDFYANVNNNSVTVEVSNSFWYCI